MTREFLMYGCEQSSLDEAIESSMQPYMGGHFMLAMSILSDAQELLAMGANDKARQNINCAKYVMNQWNDYNEQT